MKRLLVFILLLSTKILNAQFLNKIDVNINLGRNESSMQKPNYPGYSTREYTYTHPRASFRGGLGAAYRINRFFSTGIKFNYEQMGWKRDSQIFLDARDGTIFLGSATYFYHYLYMPLYVEASVGNRFQLFGQVGFSLGMPLPVHSGDGGILSDRDSVIAITLFHPAFNRRDWDRTFNYSGGIRVKLTDDCRINFQIGYQKSIKAIVNSGISKEFWHQATFGLVEIEYPLAKLLKKKIK